MPHILNLAVEKILKTLKCEGDDEDLEAELAEADARRHITFYGVGKLRASHVLTALADATFFDSIRHYMAYDRRPAYGINQLTVSYYRFPPTRTSIYGVDLGI